MNSKNVFFVTNFLSSTAASPTCLSHGFEVCEGPTRRAHCIDVADIGYICEGCLEGADPKRPGNEAFCQGKRRVETSVAPMRASVLLDRDECGLGFCGSETSCDNTFFPYRCFCDEGYHHKLSPYGQNCTGWHNPGANMLNSEYFLVTAFVCLNSPSPFLSFFIIEIFLC